MKARATARAFGFLPEPAWCGASFRSIRLTDYPLIPPALRPGERSIRCYDGDPAIKAKFVMFGRYNANGRPYDAAASLSDADFRANRGALF
jgi:hypothetical protein